MFVRSFVCSFVHCLSLRLFVFCCSFVRVFVVGISDDVVVDVSHDVVVLMLLLTLVMLLLCVVVV